VNRRRLVALAPLLLAACGPSQSQIAGAVLMVTPVVYLLAMCLVMVIHSIWRQILPEVPFGSRRHSIAAGAFALLAIYGLQYADPYLFGIALWFYGAAVLAWWLLLARMTLRSGWGFLWGGMVTTGLLALPMFIALVAERSLRAELVGASIVAYMGLGGLGVVPAIVLIVLVIEGNRAVRSVRLQADNFVDDLPIPGPGDIQPPDATPP
jgi:hypothetical protein